MSKTLHSVKLFGYDSVDLDKITYSNGDVIYDATSGTLRLMDGATQGGLKIASQPFVTSALNTALSSYVSNSSLTATLSSYATNSSVTTQINAINSSLSGYVTSSGLATTLSSYVSNASLTTTLSSYVSNASLTTTLSSYVSSSGLTTTLSNYQTTLNSKLAVTGTAGGAAVDLSTNNGTLTFASNNGLSVGIVGTTVTISSPQDLRTTASPSFANAIVGGVSIKSFAIAMAAAMA
jgi:hypothetical protein